MSQPTDTPSTPTNVNCYMEIIDYSGPPKSSFADDIHVQIRVYKDKDMTDLISVRNCYSISSMNRTLENFVDVYGLVKMATVEGVYQ